MSGGGSTTTVQKADPWKPTQAPLQNAINVAGQEFREGGFAPRPYSGERVAGFSPMQSAALDGVSARMMGPNAATAAQSGLIDMMRGGGYRDLDTVRNEALGRAIPAAVSMFSGNGMTDSSQAMDTVGRAATEAIAPIDYSAFLETQQNMLRGAALAPSVDAGTYLPAQMGMQFGGAQQGQQQAQIDAAMQRYYESATRDVNNLRGYSDLLLGYGGQGGTSTGTAPGTSPVANVAGSALSGLGIYGAMAMNPATAPFAVPAGLLAGSMGLFR